MPEELKTDTKEIMDKIKKGEIKMKPRIYFIIGYILTFLGLAFSFVTSIFFIALTRFSLRTHGPMGQYRLDQILSSFSFWIPLLAILGLTVGIWMLKKYDFSYKINFKILVVGIIISVLAAGYIIDATGLTDSVSRKRNCMNKTEVTNINNSEDAITTPN